MRKFPAFFEMNLDKEKGKAPWYDYALIRNVMPPSL